MFSKLYAELLGTYRLFSSKQIVIRFHDITVLHLNEYLLKVGIRNITVSIVW